MTITNGYCTLVELKERIQAARRYTASTISFDSGTKKISDTAKRLKRFQAGMLIDVSGSVAGNNTTFTVATGDVAGEIVVSEAVTTATAGAAVTLTDISDPIDDAVMESVIEAVSRAIDNLTIRKFLTNSIDEVRYFKADDPYHVWTGDLVSITTLETDSNGDGIFDWTWTTSDFLLWPYNAALDGKPYSRIDVASTGSASGGFPISERGVRITGKFGWSAVPGPIKEACLLQAARLFRRKDATFGVMSNNSFGTYLKAIPEMDPDVMLLIRPYRRMS